MLVSALGFVPLPIVVLIVLFLAGAAAGSQPAAAPAPAPDHSRSPMIAILVAIIAGITVIGGSIGIACLYFLSAPEILQRDEANVKLDVYSFGVVILELTTGKEAIIDRGGGNIGLVGWARQRYMELTTGKATLDNIVDEAIRNPTYMQAIQSVFILGVICTSQDPDKRPSMAQVLDQLNKCQCQQISAETTEAFQLGYDEGEGSSAPLLQRPRRTTAGGSFMRRQFSDLLRRSTAMITSSTTKRSTLSGRSSFKGLELLRRMHGTRAHTK